MLLAFAAACGLGNNTSPATFELAETGTMVWLDRYDEKQAELVSGDPEKLTWESADETIATVEDGRIIAQGEGSTTITVSDGNHKATIQVRVRNSGTKPVLRIDEFDAYKDAAIDIPAKIVYNGQEQNVSVSYTAEIEDTSIATYADGKITGVSLGTTKATIKTEYKGMSLSRKTTITVKENSVIEFLQEGVEIHKANGSKLSVAELSVKVVYCGQVVENPTVNYTIVSGAEYITLDESTVTAKAEGTATVKASYTNGSLTVEDLITVNVKPNWVATSFENTSLDANTWEEYDDEIGGRQGDIMRFKAAEDLEGYWNHRVSEKNAGIIVTELYRKGYKYFAYDVYYTGYQNFLLGFDGIETFTVAIGEYFRTDYVNCFSEDGTNHIFDRNEWITVYFDLMAIIERKPSVAAGFFFDVSDNVYYSYVTNVRFYLDNSFIPQENLSYEDKGDYLQATEDEWTVFQPQSNGYRFYERDGKPDQIVIPEEVPEYAPYDSEVGGRTGVYKYETNRESSWLNSLVLASSMNNSYDRGMLKLLDRGRFLTFDIYIEQASSIHVSLNHTSTSGTFKIGKTNLEKSEDWLAVIKDGQRQYTFTKGEWLTVSLAVVDGYLPGSWRSTILFSAVEDGSVIYIDNVRFYEEYAPFSNDYFGIAPPSQVETVRDEATVEMVAEGEFADAVKYTNKAAATTEADDTTAMYFPEVTKNNGTISPAPVNNYYRKGYQFIQFDFYLGENVSGIAFLSWSTKDAEGYRGELVGATINVGGTHTAYIFDTATQELTNTLQTGKWYTMFLQTDWDYNAWGDPFWTRVEWRIRGGSEQNPAVAYIKNLSYVFKTWDLPSYMPVATEASATQKASIVKVVEGTMAGTYAYTQNQTEHWRCSMQFINATLQNPYAENAKYISVKMYFSDAVQSIMYYDNMFTANKTTVETITIGETFTPGTYMKVYDMEGNEVNKIEANTWYEIVLKISQSSYVGWGELKLQPVLKAVNGDTTCIWMKDVALCKENPHA